MTVSELASQPSAEARRHLLALYELTAGMDLRERVFAAQMVAAQGNSIQAFLSAAEVAEAGAVAALFQHLMGLLFSDVPSAGL